MKMLTKLNNPRKKFVNTNHELLSLTDVYYNLNLSTHSVASCLTVSNVNGLYDYCKFLQLAVL